jgi:hypothetical protein
MSHEPVAWIAVCDNTSVFFDLDCALAIDDNPTPLYTHPHPDNLGLAESIIKQQQIEIEALKKQNADMNRRLLGWDIYEQ